MAGFERAVVYDIRTKERRWLSENTVLSANDSENEEFALGLRTQILTSPLKRRVRGTVRTKYRTLVN